jgi:hypothetical protein
MSYSAAGSKDLFEHGVYRISSSAFHSGFRWRTRRRTGAAGWEQYSISTGGPLLVPFHLWSNATGSGDAVRIGRITATLVE